jgi:hypothetical protein
MFMTILRQDPIGKQYIQSASGARSSTMKQVFRFVSGMSSDPESEVDDSESIIAVDIGTYEDPGKKGSN